MPETFVDAIVAIFVDKKHLHQSLAPRLKKMARKNFYVLPRHRRSSLRYGPADSKNHSACKPDQYMCWPPLIAIFAPVRNAASSDARYATSPATSSGLPRRPIGICGMILLSNTSAGIAITILVPI